MVRSEIVKGVLGEHDIEAVVINKKDSSYHFGFYEISVPQEKVLQALKIIRDEIRFD
jgi:hypothetical protein